MSYSQITTQRCTAQDSAFNHSHNFIVISSFMGDAPLLIFITEWLLTYVYIRALQDTTGKGQYNNYVSDVVYYLLVFSPFNEHRII